MADHIYRCKDCGEFLSWADSSLRYTAGKPQHQCGNAHAGHCGQVEEASPLDAVARLREASALVDELASQIDPFTEDAREAPFCFFCAETTQHDPACLWLRSRRFGHG